jgi:hypothetical protein
MGKNIIRDYKKLEIRHRQNGDKDIEALLGTIVLGTEGGLRYSVMNSVERMKSYGNGLSFIALYKRESLAGAIGLCKRSTFSCGTEYKSTFLRYLAVRSSFQISRVSRRRKAKISAFEDSFKHQIFSMFKNALHDFNEKDQPSAPNIAYAFIESSNERSRNFAEQAGYEKVSLFHTIAFSRFSLRKHPEVSRLSPHEEPVMAELLSGHYRDYCFFYDQFLFYDKACYVMKKDGMIVAGTNAIPAVFKIINFPGIAGWILMKVLPYSPYFRKIFSPGSFRFLIMDSVFCREGYEHLLPDLFESVCAAEGCNSALTWHDEKSIVYKALKKSRNLGILNRILKTSPGLVVASFSGFSPEEKKKFSEYPVFLSGVDLV